MIRPRPTPEPDSAAEQGLAAYDTYDTYGTVLDALLLAQTAAARFHRDVEQIRDRLTGRNSAVAFYVGDAMQRAAYWSRVARRLYVRWQSEGCPCP